MDFFQNMFTPITERTDITGALAAYNNSWYTLAANGIQGPIYNFKGNRKTPVNSIWTNYSFGNNFIFGNNLFGVNTNIGSSSWNGISYSPLGPIYNFSGKATNSISKTNKSDKAKNTNATNKIQNNKNTNNLKNKLGNAIATTAEKYKGYNEQDGSYKKFSNDPEWCADFVTYVVREAYKSQGKTAPSWFGNWRCETLKQQAIDHGKFLTTAGKSNQAELIKEKVKPGDIVIMRENGASHTGIVKHVNRETGAYTTIEGNVRNNKQIDCVMEINHQANDHEVSGFIQLT